MENEMKGRYQRGDEILGREFTLDAGLKVFGNVIFLDWKHDLATAQFDLERETHWKKVHPITELHPETERLLRVNEMKKPIV